MTDGQPSSGFANGLNPPDWYCWVTVAANASQPTFTRIRTVTAIKPMLITTNCRKSVTSTLSIPPRIVYTATMTSITVIIQSSEESSTPIAEDSTTLIALGSFDNVA